MFIEFRRYEIRNGQRDRFVRLMEEHVIPFQISQGMVVLGSFVVEEEPGVFIWMRRFDSEAQKETLYEAVYASESWTQTLKPRIDEMLIRETMQVTRLVPTPRSVIR